MSSLLERGLKEDDPACCIHDVKNSIATVRGLLQLLKEKEDWWSYNEYYDLMIDEINQANTIINRLLSLAKENFSRMEMRDLNKLVGAIFPVIQAEALLNNRYVRLELGEVPELLIDENSIRRLIINIARNGLEATPPESGVVIRTFTKSDRAVLAVQDFGRGMDESVLKKIGTLFFTTKENGNGLGIAICNKIAEKHNALIEASTSGAGTTFFVYFPIR